MEAASVRAGATTERRRSKGMPERRLAVLMVAPSMVLIAIVAVWPIIYAIWLSLHEYSVRVAGLSRWSGPIGLRNYSNALQSSEWHSALWHTLIFIIIADVWKTAPFMALLILAGLQVIPSEVYEAAEVDGASVWQRFTRITLPLLMPAILVALIFRTLDALRIFDLPFVLTQGQNGTSTLSTIAQETFATNRIYGLGSAMAILTFIVVMLVSFAYIRFVGGNIRGLAEE